MNPERLSQIPGDTVGFYVQVDVREVRDNTREMHESQGQYGRVTADGLEFIPVEVTLESGKFQWFWRDCLIKVDAFVCVECQNLFRGVDYLCDGCRATEGTL